MKESSCRGIRRIRLLRSEGQVKVWRCFQAWEGGGSSRSCEGDFFGEGCLTGQPRRLATVAAMTESLIMRFDKAASCRAP